MDALDILRIGGWVMYPLLVLGVISLTMATERTIFWTRMRLGVGGRWPAILRKLREGQLEAAEALAERDRTAYGWFVRGVVERMRSNRGFTEADLIELIDGVRRPIERYGVAMSAIITASPMLGILGTVTGIIQSFGLLTASQRTADPTLVAGGIAEALYTTAFGLIVALMTLFPYMVFRAAADRAFTRLESVATLAAASVDESRSEARRLAVTQ